MTFILLFWVGFGLHQGGPASAEFVDKRSCEAAMVAGHAKWTSFEGICVPKQVK